MKLLKRCACICLAMYVILTMVCTASQDAPYLTAMQNTAQYIRQVNPNPVCADVGGEWSVFALARAGLCDAAYATAYFDNLSDEVQIKAGVLSANKYTDYARAAIALTAIGRDASDVAGYNLYSYITDYERVIRQGVNGAIFALIALDFGGYDSAVRERYIDHIISAQLPNGAFGLADMPDVDITAMAVCALAGYRTERAIAQAVDRAVAYLSDSQLTSGGYASEGVENAESAAQVIAALSMLGIDAHTDSRFIKSGASLLDALLSYAAAEDGFCHVHHSEPGLMASEQALYALAAYDRMKSGAPELYRRYETGVYYDTASHWGRNDIKELVSKGVMQPDNPAFFSPDREMLRGEFTQALVLALELPVEDVRCGFTDLAPDDELSGYIACGVQNGLIYGTSDTQFSPQDPVTRAQAAAILYRAAVLLDKDEIPTDSVAHVFSDAADCPAWSRAAVQYAVSTGLIVGSEGKILPNHTITKAEIATILCRARGLFGLDGTNEKA